MMCWLMSSCIILSPASTSIELRRSLTPSFLHISAYHRISQQNIEEILGLEASCDGLRDPNTFRVFPAVNASPLLPLLDRTG